MCMTFLRGRIRRYLRCQVLETLHESSSAHDVRGHRVYLRKAMAQATVSIAGTERAGFEDLPLLW